jgi:dTDP-4-dehydrorhamnose reductase
MKKKIIIFGHKGYIGSHLLKVLKKKKLSIVGLTIPRPKKFDDFDNFYIKYINKILLNYSNIYCIINCSGSINCSTKKDFFFNSKFDLIFQKIVLKKKLRLKYLILNSTKVFTNCLDNYSLSKKELDRKIILKKNFYSLYLDLIFQKDSSHYNKIYNILKKYSNFRIPIFFPGKHFYPVDLQNLTQEIYNIMMNKQKKNRIIIIGEKKYTFYEIINYVKKNSFLKNKFFLFKSEYFNYIPSYFKSLIYRSKFLQMIDDKNWINHINKKKILLKKLKVDLK